MTLPHSVDGLEFHLPGTAAYEKATSPLNASATPATRCVVVPADADQVAAAVRTAAELGLGVVPQATGHGAAGVLGADTLLVDPGGLNELTVDASAARARAGADLTWGQVNQVAWTHGLLARRFVAECRRGGLHLRRRHRLADRPARSGQRTPARGRLRRWCRDRAERHRRC